MPVPVGAGESVGEPVPTSQLYEHATTSAIAEALARRRPNTPRSIPLTGWRTLLTTIVNKPKDTPMAPSSASLRPLEALR